MLDSLPCDDMSTRLNVVHNLLFELDDVLEATQDNYQPILGTFNLSTPSWVPRQGNSYDCGMFVVKMILSPLLCPGFSIKVK